MSLEKWEVENSRFHVVLCLAVVSDSKGRPRRAFCAYQSFDRIMLSPIGLRAPIRELLGGQL